MLVKASGWAYAGGGRNIVRVDVTGNNGKSWQTATITEGYNQPIRRAWAWVFWECEVPAIVCEDGVSVELAFVRGWTWRLIPSQSHWVGCGMFEDW